MNSHDPWIWFTCSLVAVLLFGGAIAFAIFPHIRKELAKRSFIRRISKSIAVLIIPAAVGISTELAHVGKWNSSSISFTDAECAWSLGAGTLMGLGIILTGLFSWFEDTEVSNNSRLRFQLEELGKDWEEVKSELSFQRDSLAYILAIFDKGISKFNEKLSNFVNTRLTPRKKFAELSKIRPEKEVGEELVRAVRDCIWASLQDPNRTVRVCLMEPNEDSTKLRHLCCSAGAAPSIDKRFIDEHDHLFAMDNYPPKSTAVDCYLANSVRFVENCSEPDSSFADIPGCDVGSLICVPLTVNRGKTSTPEILVMCISCADNGAFIENQMNWLIERLKVHLESRYTLLHSHAQVYSKIHSAHQDLDGHFKTELAKLKNTGS